MFVLTLVGIGDGERDCRDAFGRKVEVHDSASGEVQGTVTPCMLC